MSAAPANPVPTPMPYRVPAWLLRLAMNLWPPFLGARIHVARIAADFREVEVEMPLRLTNRNNVGTHFGGSLYAMTDPFFALMVLNNLPPGMLVWDRAATIEYVAPGRGRVRSTMRLTDADLESIVRMTAGGAKHLHVFKAEVVDHEGLVIARVEKIVYIRSRSTAEPRAGQASVAAAPQPQPGRAAS
jgi:acyl-coenzyme A thioesterase PaaI-like protein